MKRKIALILCLSMLSSTLLALIPSVKAPDGHPPFGWVEPAYVGYDPCYDPYYDGYITGYLEGTIWNLTMTWTNWDWFPINVSAIGVYFSWGKNYTYSYPTPIMVEYGVTKIFNAYNVTPSVIEAPEIPGLAPYSYIIYIHSVNSTEPPYRELSPMGFAGGSGFVALSQDHLDCLNYWSKYWMFIEGPMAMQAQLISPILEFSPNITEVQVLLIQAMMEFNQGFQIYMTGVFGEASEHFETGDELINEALTVWSEKGTAMEDANLAYQNAQANYYNGQGAYYSDLGEASKINAYGWVLFGLGWVFIGIGIVVYGARKPKTAQS